MTTTLTPPALVDRLTIDIGELAQLTGLSMRSLRRLDSDRNIPGRVNVGRRVLYRLDVIRQWLGSGCPDKERWAALQRAK